MTEQDLDAIIREFHEAREALRKAEDEVIVSLIPEGGKEADVSTAAFHSEVRRRHGDLLARFQEAAIAHEQAFAQLRRREVEAHEWMIQFRKLTAT